MIAKPNHSIGKTQLGLYQLLKNISLLLLQIKDVLDNKLQHRGGASFNLQYYKFKSSELLNL